MNKLIGFVAVLGLICGFAGAAYCQTVTFQDGVFDDADWSSEIVFSSGSVSYVSGQETVGGNPDEYRETAHTLATGGNVIEVAHWLSNAIYDPSSGAIDSIQSSTDVKKLPSAGGDIAYGLILKQGDKVYRTEPTQYSYTEWTPINLAGLTAEDFSEISASGYDPNSHPDFSTSGATIQLGFFSSNSSVSGGYTKVHGVDNWELTVNLEGGGPCAGSSAEASTYETGTVHGSSDLAKHLVYFLPPMGVLIGLRIWRMKR